VAQAGHAAGVLALGWKKYITSASVAELESERDFDAFAMHNI
jgi:hypothetical protein